MTQPTLDSLARRVEQLESKVASLQNDPPRDWRRVAGMFEGSEFMKQVDAEVEAFRQAERQAVEQGQPE